MQKTNSIDIDNAHNLIADAWNNACEIHALDDVYGVQEFAEQYAILATELNRFVREAEQAFQAVRKELVSATNTDESAHLQAYVMAYKVDSLFRQVWDSEPDANPSNNVVAIVKHIDWLQENLAAVQLHDRDVIIHRMAVELEKARVADERNWSKWDSPKQWGRVFECSPKTFKRRCEDGTIRHQRRHSKLYRIALSDIPSSHPVQQVDIK